MVQQSSIKQIHLRHAFSIIIFILILPFSVIVYSQNTEKTQIHYSGEDSLVTVASFSTSIEDQDENVKKNIAIACEQLNNHIISSKEIFSFNATVGEASIQNGYVVGRVLYRDKIRMEPGGGLCQVSSTLFNALLLTGSIIIERHRHYQPVTYVPLGLDATIKYGKKDLRIKNPYSWNLMIQTTVNDKSLIIKIKSPRGLQYKYELFTEEEEISIPFSENNENIRQGISVYIFRKKYKDNRIINSALLYKDYYPPVLLNNN